MDNPNKPELAQTEIRESSIEGGAEGIALMQTSPKSITFHRIENSELETLMNFARPVSLALSTAFLGATLGLLPSALPIWDTGKCDPSIPAVELAATAACNHPITTSELIITSVWAVCLSATIIIGIYAAVGQCKVHKLKRKIRCRAPFPLQSKDGANSNAKDRTLSA
jgi:hypothetical protein